MRRKVSRDTRICTRNGREYAEPDFLANDSPPVLVDTRMYLSDGTRPVGEATGTILNNATPYLGASEPIALYDENSCPAPEFLARRRL
jgi:hypothetical protein